MALRKSKSRIKRQDVTLRVTLRGVPGAFTQQQILDHVRAQLQLNTLTDQGPLFQDLSVSIASHSIVYQEI